MPQDPTTSLPAPKPTRGAVNTASSNLPKGPDGEVKTRDKAAKRNKGKSQRIRKMIPEEDDDTEGEVIYTNPMLMEGQGEDGDEFKGLRKSLLQPERYMLDISALTSNSEDTSDGEAWRSLGLHSAISGILTGNLKFKVPTPIQEISITNQLQGKSAIIAAPTGEGKTLAFALPAVQEVLEERLELSGAITRLYKVWEEVKGTDQGLHVMGDIENLIQAHLNCRCLIVTPTRELAQQIMDHIMPFEVLLTPKPYVDSTDGTETCLPPSPLCSLLVGGVSLEKQERLIDFRTPIVIGTPGRLLHFIETVRHPHLLTAFGIDKDAPLQDLDGTTDSAKAARRTTPGQLVRRLVLDEADRMLQVGRYKELDILLTFIRSGFAEGKYKAKELRLILASATLALPHVKGVVERDMTQRPNKVGAKGNSNSKKGNATGTFRGVPVEEIKEEAPNTTGGAEGKRPAKLEGWRRENDNILVALSTRLAGLHDVAEMSTYDSTTSTMLPRSITETFVFCPSELYKHAFIIYFLLNYNYDTLVFCNTKHECRLLSALLSACNIINRVIEGDGGIRKRGKAIEYMNLVGPPLGQGKDVTQTTKVLLCTDLVARGVDLPSVSCVIHYDMPSTPDIYIHRTGRTGRAGRVGLSISCLLPVLDMAPTKRDGKKRGAKDQKGGAKSKAIKQRELKANQVLPVHPALLSVVGAGKTLLSQVDVDNAFETMRGKEDTEWELQQRRARLVSQMLKADGDNEDNIKELREIEEEMKRQEQANREVSETAEAQKLNYQGGLGAGQYVSEFCVDSDLFESYFEPADLARRCAVLAIEIAKKEVAESLAHKMKSGYEKSLDMLGEVGDGEDTAKPNTTSHQPRDVGVASDMKRQFHQTKFELDTKLCQLHKLELAARVVRAHKRQQEILEVLHIYPTFEESSRHCLDNVTPRHPATIEKKAKAKRKQAMLAPPPQKRANEKAEQAKQEGSKERRRQGALKPQQAPDLMALFKTHRKPAGNK